jgi:glycosyltransferase involved in cell wall biosynthesis
MAEYGKMRVNIVVGGRFHAGQLYEALTEIGHDAHVYASSPARYFRSVPANRVTFVPKPVQFLQKGLKIRMPRWMAEHSATLFDLAVSRLMRPADIVWGFNGDSIISARRIKNLGGHYVCDRACPHILAQQELLQRESEQTGYPYSPLTSRALQRFLDEYAIADRIVVPSTYSARSFPAHGVGSDRLAIAPLDANAPMPLDREAATVLFDGVPDGEILIGMVGGSFLRKGILYLLQAVDALGRRDIRIVLRADATSILRHDEARRLCQRLNVIFVPYLNDINSFYRSVDMFVLPSVDEGFGMVVYEALRNGTAVIATSNVGAIDGMEPSRDFLKVPARDVAALSAAIARLAADPAERTRIGAAGRAFHARRMSGGGQYRKAVQNIIDDLVRHQL